MMPVPAPRIDRPLRCCRPRQPQSGLSRRSGERGFTIVESLIAVVILTVSIGILALLFTRQWSSSRDLDVLQRLENAVATDVGWLKSYAKYWRMTRGPFNLTCSQAGFPVGCDPFVISPTTTAYLPDEASCNSATGLAQDFVTAAAAVTISPPRPFTVAVGDTTLLNSASDTGRPLLPSGTTLVRSISLGKNLIYISYRFSGANADPYRFRRELALMPEAASWCT